MDILEKLENEGYTFTFNPLHAIYIFPFGEMLDGDFVDGDRCNDHRCIETITEHDRYDGEDFWEEVFDLGLILVEPEPKIYMYPDWMYVTKYQEAILGQLNDLGYEYEEWK